MAGYRAGMTGQKCPDDASESFKHGWRNGRIDAGFAAALEEQERQSKD